METWCPEAESNHRHGDFQSPALPTELSGLTGRIKPYSAQSVKHFLHKFIYMLLIHTTSYKSKQNGETIASPFVISLLSAH